MPISPRTLRPSSTFSPRSISGLALWLDASDGATLFQNSDGTVPATASSDPVGYWADKSGNGRHAVQATAASRPTISATAQNGRRVVSNSTDQSFLRFDAPVGTAITLLYAGKPSTRANSYILGGATSDTGILSRFSNGGTVRDYEWWNGNGSDRVIIATSQASFSLIGLSHQDAGAILAYVNGAQTNTKGTASATITGTSLKILGAANTAGTAPANNEYGEFLVYNRVLTAAERQRLERYLATRWGITLAPQVSNADAQDWVNRVYQQGGSVSSATASAVNTFCESIASAGIRDRFYRLNLFAGNSDASLAAVRTPLFRGPSLGGTQYGNTTDTNANFVAGDYSETSGLLGNGSTKYLNTGLAPNALPDYATGHLSVYAMTGFGGSTIYGLLSSLGAGFAENYTIEANRNPAGLNGAWGKGGAFSNLATSAQGAGNGHTTVSRTSSTALSAYRSGNLLRTDSTSVTPGSSAANWYVFGHNANGTSVDNYAAARLGGYSIGAALTGQQAADYYTAMQAFQTALTRNV